MTDATVQVQVTCVSCGATKLFQLPYSRYIAWQNGMLIQDAFPEMPAADRELLISGLCPDCWNALWEGLDNE